MEKWNISYFKEFLSQYNATPVGNRCAMERILFMLLGLNLRVKEDAQSLIAFDHYSMLFDKSLGIMKGPLERLQRLNLKMPTT
jgi:hypothetical protein